MHARGRVAVVHDVRSKQLTGGDVVADAGLDQRLPDAADAECVVAGAAADLAGPGAAGECVVAERALEVEHAAERRTRVEMRGRVDDVAATAAVDVGGLDLAQIDVGVGVVLICGDIEVHVARAEMDRVVLRRPEDLERVVAVVPVVGDLDRGRRIAELRREARRQRPAREVERERAVAARGVADLDQVRVGDGRRATGDAVDLDGAAGASDTRHVAGGEGRDRGEMVEAVVGAGRRSLRRSRRGRSGGKDRERDEA